MLLLFSSDSSLLQLLSASVYLSKNLSEQYAVQTYYITLGERTYWWDNNIDIFWSKYDYVLQEFVFFQYHNTVHDALRKYIKSFFSIDHFSFFFISQEWITRIDCYLFRISLADVQMAWWCSETQDFMWDVPPAARKHEMAQFRPLFWSRPF